MPSTRSQAGVDTPAGEAAEVAEALEEAAAELSAEIAARRASEARVQALQAQLAAEGGGDAFAHLAHPSTHFLCYHYLLIPPC